MRWMLFFLLVAPVFGQFGPSFKVVQTKSGIPEILPDFSHQEYELKSGLRVHGWPKIPEMKTLRVADHEAVKASWEGEDLTWARNATIRTKKAWTYFEPMELDEIQARDYYISLCQQAYGAGLPQEAARGAYLDWLRRVFEGRLEALAEAEGRQVDLRQGQSIERVFGREADLAHLDWACWAAMELLKFRDRLEAYSRTQERRTQMAKNSQKGYEISGTNRAIREMYASF